MSSENSTNSKTNLEDSESLVKYFRKSEVEKNNNRESCWIIIHNNVYNVTSFLDDHPGGEEVLIEKAGKIATQDFEDVGHSTEAKTLLKDYFIGELHKDDRVEKNSFQNQDIEDSDNQWKSWLIPFGLAILSTIVYRYIFGHKS